VRVLGDAIDSDRYPLSPRSRSCPVEAGGRAAGGFAGAEGLWAAVERAVSPTGLGNRTVRTLVARVRSLVDWAGTIWSVIGWLGGTAWITGVGIAVLGAIWAVVKGVPVPIAIMAGYCTFVGAVVLTLAPLAYRALSRIAAFPVPHDAAAPQQPNAAVWQHVPNFNLYQAACLLAEVTPAYNSWKMEGDAQAWFETLIAEIRAKEMTHIPTIYDKKHTLSDGYHPNQETTVSRAELQHFAQRHRIRPRFLFPD
jgi:hypothetical protein